MDSIDDQFLVSTLTDLIAIKSLPGAELPAQEYVASLLGELGAETDVWEIDFDSPSSRGAWIRMAVCPFDL